VLVEGAEPHVLPPHPCQLRVLGDEADQTDGPLQTVQLGNVDHGVRVRARSEVLNAVLGHATSHARSEPLCCGHAPRRSAKQCPRSRCESGRVLERDAAAGHRRSTQRLRRRTRCAASPRAAASASQALLPAGRPGIEQPPSSSEPSGSSGLLVRAVPPPPPPVPLPPAPLPPVAGAPADPELPPEPVSSHVLAHRSQPPPVGVASHLAVTPAHQASS